MADTFTFDKEHLTNLKTKVVNLNNDLLADPKIAAIQEWGDTTLWDKSTWNSPSGAPGGSGGSGGNADLLLLTGNGGNFPAAKLLTSRGTAYASMVINAVNWVHEVLTNLASNIDYTIHHVETAEHDNTMTVNQAITDFNQTIGDLGGPPTPNGPLPPHLP
jgi:hypothetical protein